MLKLNIILVFAITAYIFPAQVDSCPSGRKSCHKAEKYCVMSYQCKDGCIVTEGDDLIDERSHSCDAPKVWCKLCKSERQISTTTVQPSPRTIVPITSRTPAVPGQPCTAADKSPGRCLYPHLCRNDSSVIDGSGGIDERTSSSCPTIRDAIQICCPESLLPDDIDGPTTMKTTTTTGRSDDGDVRCETKYSEEGKCVPFYQCVDDDNDGSNVINVRSSSNGPCPYLKVCCSLNHIDKNKEPPTPAPNPRCGVRHEDGVVYKKYSGRTNEAKFGEFPWMIAVRTRTSPRDDSYNISGGSLIHPSVVLTAAHYVNRAYKNDIRARAGEWDLLTTDEPLPHQERQVRRTLQHPAFNDKNKQNDIALLFVEAPFELGPHVAPLCLPPAARAQPSADCVANGWGKDKFGREGTLQTILKKTILPVVGNSQCQEQLRNTRLGPFFRLHDGFMCAGGEKRDTCTQDGGGPLACTYEQDPDRYIIWGVVSWGIGCGTDGVPGVYIDVSRYRDWVQTEAAAEGYDLDQYDL